MILSTGAKWVILGHSERRGRFGLPPVFSSVDRLGVVEVEAASRRAWARVTTTDRSPQ